MRKTAIVGLSFLFLLGFIFVTSAPAAKDEEFKVDKAVRVSKKAAAEREILVKFKEGVTHEKIKDTHKKRGTVVLSVNKKLRVHKLRTPRGKSREEVVASYRADRDVAYAEPNFEMEAHFIPNDPYYRYQWHFDDSLAGANPYGGANGGGINLEPAWDTTTGSNDVVVAVVDTGVAYENYTSSFVIAPDLANTKFVAGYDFISGDAHANDQNGHGTHVTGTIAQSTNNGVGVAGIAFNTTIMPVQVLDASGSGTVQTVSDGIVFAADNGAKVINLSLGSSFPSATLENAVAYAYGKGVTVVASAGNDNGPVSYPAAYDSYVIAVAATRYDETRSPYSNFGTQVDVAAPGGDTAVDQNGDGYGDGVLQQTFQGNPKRFAYYFFQGTSMAAPHVSGVAALLIAKGVSGPERIREAIEKSAEDKGAAGRDDVYGWGLLDAKAALEHQFAQIHDLTVTGVSASSTVVQGNSALVTVAVKNLGDFTETVSVRLLDQTDNVEIGVQSATVASQGSANVVFNWNTETSSLGDHSLKGSADPVEGETNTGNNSATTTVTVRAPSHDVAVIALDTPLTVSQGSVVAVKVTMENQGTYQETATVLLRDLTENVSIGQQDVTLTAGEQKVVTFNWDTTGSSLGIHTIEASAGAVPGETDTADNSMTNTSEIQEPAPSPKLHVADIAMSLERKSSGYAGRAKVKIYDAVDASVSGATVSGDFSFNGVFLRSASGNTKSDGTILLRSSRVPAKKGDIFTFAVQNVTKLGYAYDPTANVETSDSITV